MKERKFLGMDFEDWMEWFAAILLLFCVICILPVMLIIDSMAIVTDGWRFSIIRGLVIRVFHPIDHDKLR